MTALSITLTLADRGRRMSLAEFDRAESADGRLYELSRGIVTVVEVPNVRHFLQVDAIRRQLYLYQDAHPDLVRHIGSGAECKMLIEELDSERHPDLLIYHSNPPAHDVWSLWIPELVVEVVSESSRDRDYEEKPDEYLRFGVKEYWIVDWYQRAMTVHRRSRGRWKTSLVQPPARHTTHLLPGFELDLEPVFSAADRAPDS
jgi:Uma2 family endonuclease